MPLGAACDVDAAGMPTTGSDLPFSVHRLGRLDVDRVADELVRRAADEDLARRRGGLLEPGRDVDRVADHDRLARPTGRRRRPRRC